MTKAKTPLADRLRDHHSDLAGDDYWTTIFAERKEAAAEIDRLTALLSAKEAECERLRTALTECGAGYRPPQNDRDGRGFSWSLKVRTP